MIPSGTIQNKMAGSRPAAEPTPEQEADIITRMVDLVFHFVSKVTTDRSCAELLWSNVGFTPEEIARYAPRAMAQMRCEIDSQTSMEAP
jgi:hypothetical protein